MMTHKNAVLNSIHKCSVSVKPFRIVPGHTMKANRVEVQLHSFLTMALDGWVSFTLWLTYPRQKTFTVPTEY